MNDIQSIIRTLLQERGMSKTEYGRRLGNLSGDTIYQRLEKQRSLSVELVVPMLDVLGYKLVVMRDYGATTHEGIVVEATRETD